MAQDCSSLWEIDRKENSREQRNITMLSSPEMDFLESGPITVTFSTTIKKGLNQKNTCIQGYFKG